ncbi:MAG: hypothetical protein II793_02015 [Bacteroidales bacterium]|nr:hypothetical protein [Bacteroidales bacterium]
MEAQTNFAKEWKKIDKLIKEQSFKSAFEAAQKVTEKARKEGRGTEQLIGTWYMNGIGQQYQEYDNEIAIQRYEALIPTLSGADKMVCHALIARQYNEYGLRYIPDEKVRTTELLEHRSAALSDVALLQKTKIGAYKQLCESKGDDLPTVIQESEPLRGGDGDDSLMITPTLYDLLVRNEMEMCEDAKERYGWIENLLKFHTNDGNEDLMVYLEKELLEQQDCIPNGTKSTIADWEALITKYSSNRSRVMGQVYLKVIERLRSAGEMERAIDYCERTMKLFGESPESGKAQSIKKEIVQPWIEPKSLGIEPSGRENMVVVEIKNVETLYCRIVEYVGKKRDDYDKLGNSKALKAWEQPTTVVIDHRKHKIYCYLPAMPTGHYALLLSSTSDFKQNGFAVVPFDCCDATFVASGNSDDALRSGYIINQTTGQPIVGQEICLQKERNNGKIVVLERTKSDENGWFEFKHHSEDSWWLYVSTNYNGYELRKGVRLHDDSDKEKEERYTIMLDRPVYKPGEEVQFAFIAYTSDKWQVAAPRDAKYKFVLKDLNDKTIDTLIAESDDMGRMHGKLQLPEGCLPGTYHIKVVPANVNADDYYWRDVIYNATVKVEAYKQPTFAVKLWSDENDYQFGCEAHVAGSAVSYSGVPLNDAKVSYTIERSHANRWWRWWAMPRNNKKVVASGETVTDSKGNFMIDFTPEPDSSIELTKATLFNYTVKATVTDLNGETHEQTMEIRVGYVGGSLMVVGDSAASELTSVKFQYLNNDGNPVAGKVRVVVERLRQNAEPLLMHHNHSNEALHTISREEFAKRFAGMAYSADDLALSRREAEATVFDKMVETTQESTESSVNLPTMQDGIYRIRLTTTDKNGETIEGSQTVVVTSKNARQCQSDDLIWSEVDRSRAEVGETLHLRIGTRHNDVNVMLAISDGNGNVERKQIPLTNQIKTIDIKVSKEMLGGMTISLIAMKDGVEKRDEHVVEIPFSHKKLKTHLETFHNKLLPGGNEEWTLRISGANGEKVDAATVMTMYDDALDNYGTLAWHLWPWRGNNSQRLLHHDYEKFYSSDGTQNHIYHDYISYSPIILQLNTLQIIFHKRTRLFSASYPMAAKSIAVADRYESMIEESAMIERNDITGNAIDNDNGGDETVEEKKQEEHHLRENLNTLAFFYPTLRSDENGVTTIRFTVPDLLTEWNLRGISYTADMQVGEVREKVVTQKELMVMPMIPRFFRHGDKAVLSVKVSNLTDQEQHATVRLNMTDAEIGKAWSSYNPVDVTVPAKGSTVANFEVEVPRWSYAVIYKVTAENEQHSDGEQSVVAVLSNRQMVTESQAMYVNGRGEKRYDLPQLPESDTREMRLMSVEFTANPIWLAIQSLPYVSEHENPSNIYLFNKWYCSRVASSIVDANSKIQEVFAQWKTDTVNTLQSRLMQNADLKQTMMEETPWLQCAESETQNMQQIANYFDKQRIEREMSDALDKISASQRYDGSFSWMPDGEWSSEYTTRYLLRVMGNLSQQERDEMNSILENAMEYVDKEVSEYYSKYIKKDKVKDAMDVDYLYIHSCYPDLKVSRASNEAYNYYMKNAERMCLKQSGLYYRAMLALVMQRAGKKELAQKLVKQLKECSLESDEMGMYWRDNVSGYFWTDRPIEVQSFLIQAFMEVEPNDKESVGLMRQWLLKQKQTTSWNSDIASVSAISALLSDGKPLTEGTPATITVGSTRVEAPSQAGTGYVAQRWTAEQIKPDMTSVTISQENESIGWGAAYWQYIEDIDKIPASDMGIKLRKAYLIMKNDGTFTELKEGDPVKIGDRMKVQILVDCDRNLEFVELKEGRPAGFEPVSSTSGWRWNEGLSYYMAITNTAMHCYMDRLDKGRYVISYELFATQAGTFSTGLSMVQCLYAPEFRAKTAGRKIEVKP